LGNNIKWYSDPELLNLEYEGNIFNTNLLNPGNYQFYATQNSGTSQSTADTVTLIIYQIPSTSVLLDSSYCESTIVSTKIGSEPVAGHSYSWTSSQGDLVSSLPDPTVHPSVPGIFKYYLIETIDSTGCDKSDSVTITVNPNPSVSITPDQNPIEKGSSTLLTASGADTYLWSPADSLSSTTGTQVTASPIENNTYILVGTNQYGCTDNDTLELFVNCPVCGQETFYDATGSFNFGCANNLYKNNLDCSWTLLPSGVDSIYLVFDAPFDIKEGDFVRVYNGGDATAPLIGEYNNAIPPPALVRSGNSMFIRFTTDSQEAGLGFQARWSNSPITGAGEHTWQDVEIYPNPASQTLTIRLNSLSRKKTTVSFFSETGQMLHLDQYISEPGINTKEYDIRGWNAGIYFIRIVTRDIVVNSKFVKE
jgi:hypothetical protein